MRIFMLVNDPAELKATMATALLAWRFAGRGHMTVLVGVEGFSWGITDGPRAHGYVVHATRRCDQALARIADTEPISLDLRSGDVLMMRTNPARDPSRAEVHRAALGLARLARDRGVVVLNDPDAIERVGSKLYLLELPTTLRPRQVLSAELSELLAFAHSEGGPIVLKPLWGTRGDGVVRVDVRTEGDEALVAAAVALLDGGPVVAQEYLWDAPNGDTRVLLLDGEPIEVDGHVAAVRRVPQPGEFRSNVHLGASPAPGLWTPSMQAVVAAVGPYLREAGVFLAGLDVVGDKIVEVNAFAPGGFMNAESFSKVDFLGCVLDAVQERVGLRAAE